MHRGHGQQFCSNFFRRNRERVCVWEEEPDDELTRNTISLFPYIKIYIYTQFYKWRSVRYNITKVTHAVATTCWLLMGNRTPMCVCVSVCCTTDSCNSVHLPINFRVMCFFLFVCKSIIEKSLFLVVNKMNYIKFIIKTNKKPKNWTTGEGESTKKKWEPLLSLRAVWEGLDSFWALRQL